MADLVEVFLGEPDVAGKGTEERLAPPGSDGHKSQVVAGADAEGREITGGDSAVRPDDDFKCTLVHGDLTLSLLRVSRDGRPIGACP